jgi:hypothetical protein
MEQQYIIDTNSAIDYLGDKLPETIATLIDNSVKQISVISRVELLGWQNASLEHLQVLNDFINSSIVITFEEEIILKTIELRRTHTIKIPDAIIAATAIVHNATLITRNIKDFDKIPELKLLNPFAV